MSNINLINLVDHYEKENDNVQILGLLSLATVLKNKSSHNVKIIDFQHEYSLNKYTPQKDFQLEMEQLYSYVIDNKPNLVGFYTMCSNYHLCIPLAKLIKERNPDAIIVFGGPQATLTAKDSIRNIEWIDAIALGEGEDSIFEIVNTLLNNEDLSKVRGVVFKSNNSIIDTGMPKLIEDLDTLPLLDYSFIEMEKARIVNIDVGRGCPFNCTFCSTKSFWERNFRLKSANRIVEEIKNLKEQYNIQSFSLTHDLFTANKKKLLEFCDLLISQDVNISWSCSSRVDTLDEEMIKMMGLAGCKKMFLGIETGSARMQKLINKNLDLKKIIPTVKLLKENNIIYKLSFIYGFPEENRDDINMTLNLINELLNNILITFNTIQLHSFTFFPSTELTERHCNNLIFSDKVNATMLSDLKLPQEINDFIKNNKKIFPHFFHLKGDNQREYEGLDKFIPIVYLITQPKFKFTYKLLLNYYNNDLLKLFSDYKVEESSLLEKITYFQQDNLKNIINDSIESIKRFVEKRNFGAIDFVLKHIVKFEYDVTKFLLHSKEKEQLISYPIDVFTAVKNNTLEGINENITVKFNRTSEKNINVSKT